MEEEIPKPKKIDRVELLPESIDRLQSWQKQIDNNCPKVMTSKKDLVNWVIAEHKETLSDSDLRKIRDRFFDPVQYLKSLLRKAEAAKSQGQEVEIQELFGTQAKPKKTKSTTKSDLPETQEPT